MLAAALAMAIGTVMSRWVSQWVDPIVATGWHMVLGAFPLALGALLEGREAWEFLTPLDYAALGYSTVLGSAVAYALFFYFAAQGNLTSLSALTFLTPVFALTFGVSFLGETLSNWQLCGVFLTLVSVYVVNQREQLRQLWGQGIGDRGQGIGNRE
jgi:drug/metabolite transporter (DMT)-like permease